MEGITPKVLQAFWMGWFIEINILRFYTFTCSTSGVSKYKLTEMDDMIDDETFVWKNTRQVVLMGRNSLLPRKVIVFTKGSQLK